MENENYIVNQAASAAEMGTSSSNLYIDINGQGTGTLTGANVDPSLVETDRLLGFSEQMSRVINSAAENNLFTAGEIDASWVYIEIMRTQAAMYLQNCFYQGTYINLIDVYRADMINSKLNVTESIKYTNCVITKIEASAVSLEGSKLDTLKVWFRFLQRTDTLYFFNQVGQPQGQIVSTIDLTTLTLQSTTTGGTASTGG